MVLFMFIALLILIVLVVYFVKQKKNQSINTLNFTNSCNTKEEYEKRKLKKIEFATNDFYFWEKLKIPSFKINKNYLKKWICPYCGQKLTPKKGNTFKCQNCKQKIFRKREILTTEEGLFTEEQKEQINFLWSEYQQRIKFLECYQYMDNILLPKPTLNEIGEIVKPKFTENKKQNIKTLITYLHLGSPDFYKKENINKLRESRYYEGKFQNIYGTVEQSTNAFMSVLYIDLIGDYCELYNDVNYTKDELREDGFEEWSEGFIAPAIYSYAFQEDLTLEKNKEIFMFNANSLVKLLQFTPPISPEEAWQRILEYRKNLE